MLWNSVGSLTYYICQWLVTVLVVRLSSGFDAAGILALAMSIYNIFQPLAVYRMYTYQVSDVRRENTTAEYLAFRTLSTFVAFALCFGYAAFTCSPSAFVAVVLYCLYKGIALVTSMLQGHEQLCGRMDYIGKSLAIQGVTSLVSFCAVLFVSQSIHGALGAMTLSAVLVAVLYDIPRYRSFENLSFGISRGKAWSLAVRCFPAVISSVAFAASLSISRQYLAYLEGDAALGIYASIAAPAAIIQMGATYIYNPLLSIFARYYAEQRTRALIMLLVKVSIAIAIVGVLSALILNLVAPWLFRLMFGDRILSYLYLLTPVVAVTIISAFAWFLNDLLLIFRCFDGSFVGNVVAFVAAIPATLYCVSEWGMNGVSFSGIISCAVSVAVMLAFVVVLLIGITRAGKGCGIGKS